MARFTKKHMVDDYERLHRHADLLELYLYDTQSGRKPDGEERYSDKNGSVRIQLWRATGADGGYVVIRESLPNIWRLDDAVRMYADNHTEYTLGIRICLERLAVKRNQLCAAA